MSEYDPSLYRRGYIYSIDITDFKGIQKFHLTANPGMNILYGGNGSGKSSLFTAIRWCFSPSDQMEGNEKTEKGFVRTGATSCSVTIKLVKVTGDPTKLVSFTKTFVKRNQFLVDGKIVSKNEYDSIVKGFSIASDSIIQFMAQHVADKLAKDGGPIRLERILKISDPMISEALKSAIELQYNLTLRQQEKHSLSSEMVALSSKKEELQQFKASSENCIKKREELIQVKQDRSILDFHLLLKASSAFDLSKDSLTKEVQRLTASIEETNRSVLSKMSEVDNKTASIDSLKESLETICTSQLPYILPKLSTLETIKQSLADLSDLAADNAARDAEIQAIEKNLKELNIKIDKLSEEIVPEQAEMATVGAAYDRVRAKKRSLGLEMEELQKRTALEPRLDYHYIQQAMYRRCNRIGVNLEDIKQLLTVAFRSSNTFPPMIYFASYSEICEANKLEQIADLLVNKKNLWAQFITLNENPQLKEAIRSSKSKSITYMNTNRFNVQYTPTRPPNMPNFICTSFDLFMGNQQQSFDRYNSLLNFCIFLKDEGKDINFEDLKYTDFGYEAKGNVSEIYLIGQNGIQLIELKLSPKNQTRYIKKRQIALSSSKILESNLLTLEREMEERFSENDKNFKKSKSDLNELKYQIEELNVAFETVERDYNQKTASLSAKITERTMLSSEIKKLVSTKISLSSHGGSLESLKSRLINCINKTSSSLKSTHQIISSYDFKSIDTIAAHENELKDLKYELKDLKNSVSQLSSAKSLIETQLRELLNQNKSLYIDLSERQMALEKYSKFVYPRDKNSIDAYVKSNFKGVLCDVANDLKYKQQVLEQNLQNFDHLNKKAIEYDKVEEELFDKMQIMSSVEEQIRLTNLEKTEKFEYFRDSLQEILRECSRTYNELLSRFDARGFCELNVPVISEENQEYDLKKAGIAIKTSFIPGVEPGLSSNSGGENSFSSLCFAMALSKISKYPFRAVDEIDQGLDDLNNRKVQLLLFEAVKDMQYFVGTPKLPDAMFFNNDATFHFIMPWNLEV